jgi:hypothetical protein
MNLNQLLHNRVIRQEKHFLSKTRDVSARPAAAANVALAEVAGSASARRREK